ncbi:hypothetical protein ACFLV4_02020 [Chloroflexota bacterium]
MGRDATIRNPYIWAGLSLLVAGSMACFSAYFIFDLTWITALGISLLILSFILLALGRTIPNLSPEVCVLLLETGITSIAAVIEELGVRSRAIYLPSSLTRHRPQALIPLRSNLLLPRIAKSLPQRLIVQYGDDPDDTGLLVTTVGTTAVGMLESIPSPSSSELESALTYLFRVTLGIADGTTIITRDNHISAVIHNPRFENKATWSHQCLGSPMASIVASVIAEAWDKPITIKQEEQHKRKYHIELEVME